MHNNMPAHAITTITIIIIIIITIIIVIVVSTHVALACSLTRPLD